MENPDPPKDGSGLDVPSRWQNPCWTYWCIAITFAYIVVVVALTFAWNHIPVLVLLLAIVPTLVVFGVLRYLQRENVSMALLVEMFWLGLVGAIPIAFIEAGLAWLTIRHWQDSRNLGVMFAVATLNAFIVAALIEESFKYLCITRVVANERSENCWNRHPRRAYGVVLCGCAAGVSQHSFVCSNYIMLCYVQRWVSLQSRTFFTAGQILLCRQQC